MQPPKHPKKIPVLNKILNETVDVITHNLIFNYSFSTVKYDYDNNKIIINKKEYSCKYGSVYDKIV